MAIASVATVTAPAGGSLTDQASGALLDDGVTTASSVRASVTATASATPHTAGSYVEIDPSLSANAAGIWVTVSTDASSAGADSSTLLEIATGAAASEVAWATVAAGYRAGNPGPFFVPGFIASGARVAVRCRSAIVSQSIAASYAFAPVKSIAPAAPVTMGEVTAASRGTTVTAPGSLNTKGAWTEIVSSTASAFGLVYAGIQAAGATTMNASGVLIDIGIGAAAAETVLISDLYYPGNASEFYRPNSTFTFGVSVPAGSRLSARYQRANANNAVDLLLVGA